jgi:hypothetical protein
VARTFFSVFFQIGFLDGFFFFRGLERVGPTEQIGLGSGRPMGQKNFTGRVTARVKNRVKHTFFLQTLKNSLNFLIIFFFQQ